MAKPKPILVVTATLLSADGYYDRDESSVTLVFGGDGDGVVPTEIVIGVDEYRFTEISRHTGGVVSAEYRNTQKVGVPES